MKNLFILGILIMWITPSLEAAPRNRRWNRRPAAVRINTGVSRSSYHVVPAASAAATTGATATSSVSAVTAPPGENPRPLNAPSDSVVERNMATVDGTTLAQEARTVSLNAAFAEMNALRTRRGLRPFVEDPQLSAVARVKATIQARRGAVYHPGGSMGGARYEGVGMGPQFATCYQYATHGKYAGAASVLGRDGRRYHCLLLR